MQAFKTFTSGDRSTDAVQSNMSVFTQQFDTNPLISGRLISDVVLGATAVNIAHKLGRELQGWIVVDKNAQQDIWRSSTALPKTFLTLTAAGTVTASLWVF